MGGQTTHRFPDIHHYGVKYQSFFPTKQAAVHEAVSIAETEPLIEKLVVFGSAITTQCGMISDLDLAVTMPRASEKEKKRIFRRFFMEIPSSEVDIIDYTEIKSSSLKDEIDKKGVTAYAKH